MLRKLTSEVCFVASSASHNLYRQQINSLVLSGALSIGFVFPLIGIAPPSPLFLKYETPQFEVVSQLDKELNDFILEKQQRI